MIGWFVYNLTVILLPLCTLVGGEISTRVIGSAWDRVKSKFIRTVTLTLHKDGIYIIVDGIPQELKRGRKYTVKDGRVKDKTGTTSWCKV